MPFQFILANLMAINERAVGVLFLDDTGEAVDVQCADDFSPYKLRILGAYLGIHLRQIDQMVNQENQGESRMLHVETESLHTYAVPLSEGYFLVLVQRPPALVGQAQRTILQAAEALERELFATT